MPILPPVAPVASSLPAVTSNESHAMVAAGKVHGGWTACAVYAPAGVTLHDPVVAAEAEDTTEPRAATKAAATTANRRAGMFTNSRPQGRGAASATPNEKAGPAAKRLRGRPVPVCCWGFTAS
ncbi:hypothetical protein GCM10010527_00610 [Streptomyces drozdowiczii]